MVLAAGLVWLLRKATDRRFYLVCLAWIVILAGAGDVSEAVCAV